MRVCARRLAYQRDTQARGWARGGARSSLGIVAHALTELVLSGAAPLEDRRSWLESKWNELLAGQHQKLQDQWPESKVPNPSSWRGEVATRVRLLRTLETIEVAGQGSNRLAPAEILPGSSSAGGGPGPLPWVEKTLKDAETGLAGKPDRVEESAGRIRLIDLKSGVGQSEVDERQERQLRLYAYLVETALGRRPDDVLVVDVRGTETTIDASSAQVDEAVQDGVEARDRFAEMVAQRHFPASPSADVCRWCPFRAVCPDYWTARDEEWLTLDVRGVVVEKGTSGVVVSTDGTREQDMRLIGENLLAVELNDEIAVLDLDRAGAGAARLRWSSRVRTPSPSIVGG